MNKYVLDIQKELKAHGYNTGHLDGIAGPKTVEAVKAALSHTGITPNYPPVGKFKLSQTSLNRLKGVHPDLQNVVKRAIAITEVDFTVGEGLRTLAKQKQLMKQGATKTMNSRHLTGHAVDLFALDENGKVTWDWKYYYPVANAMKQAAKELNIRIEWGGDWTTFKDGPHYQLPWATYPK